MLILLAVLFVVAVRARATGEAVGSASAKAWKEVLATREVWSIGVAYFCLNLTRYTLLFWLPLYLVERLNYTIAEAGYRSASYEISDLWGFL